MKKSLLTFSSLLLAIVLIGQNNLPDNFFYKKLPNGLEMLVIEDNAVPLATVEIAVHNGAYCEDANYDGLSHLYEHMFFKANKKLPSQEKFMERVSELGVSFNGTTSGERVNYYVTLGNHNLKPAIQFMNDAIRYPLFLESEMKAENPVVDGEFQRAESDPTFFLMKDMDKALWGKNYSRKNTIGDHDIILTATPEKMRVIQEKYYYPNNSIIAVAGDVNHEEVFAEVEKIFGDWKASEFDIFEKYPIPEFEPLKDDKYFVTVSENVQTPIVMLGWHGPDTRNDIKSTYAADVFSFILQQNSSKLQADLIQSGLAYQVQLYYITQKHTGPIQMFLVPNPDKIQEAIDMVNKHVDMWTDPDYFTDEQLETAKMLLAIDDVKGKEKTSEFIHGVTFWWAVSSIDYYTSYVENLKSITREDITNYVSTYIKGQPKATGLLLTPEKHGEIIEGYLATPSGSSTNSTLETVVEKVKKKKKKKKKSKNN